MAECKTEKSKHLQQRKNFGTAGKEIEKNFLTCIVALNDGKRILGISYVWASLSVEEESVNFI